MFTHDRNRSHLSGFYSQQARPRNWSAADGHPQSTLKWPFSYSFRVLLRFFGSCELLKFDLRLDYLTESEFAVRN